MFIFWTNNKFRGESYDAIKEMDTTDWFDSDTNEYRTAYDSHIYILDENAEEFILEKFIDFMYIIYTNFNLCSADYKYSNIEKEDVELILKELINKNPRLFLKIRNSVITAPIYRFSSYGNNYKSEVEEFVNDLADNYVKKYFPTEYKIFNMELKLKK